MSQFINLDEVYNVLTENTDKLSKSMQQELSYVCDLSNNDDYYVFADLIRTKRSKSTWSVYKTECGKTITLFEKSSIELKKNVYDVLVQKNIIYGNEFTNLVVCE